jgi:hypothetical protein
VPAWVYTAYKDGVIPKLQTRGYLLQGTTTNGSVEGTEVQWFTGGRMETEEVFRGFEQSKLQNPARGYIKRTFRDYAAAATVQIVDMNKVKPDELGHLQTEGAAAIGRRSDWITLDELWAQAQAGAISTVGDGTAPIDIVPLLKARDDIAGIGDIQTRSLFVAIPEYAFSQLCLVEEFSTQEWVGEKLPLTKLASEYKSFRGMSFFTLPDEYFVRQGDVKDTGSFHGWMWWKGGVGMERNDPKLDVAISYLPLYRSWLFDNIIGGAAATLQPDACKRLWFKWTPAARAP